MNTKHDRNSSLMVEIAVMNYNNFLPNHHFSSYSHIWYRCRGGRMYICYFRGSRVLSNMSPLSKHAWNAWVRFQNLYKNYISAFKTHVKILCLLQNPTYLLGWAPIKRKSYSLALQCSQKFYNLPYPMQSSIIIPHLCGWAFCHIQSNIIFPHLLYFKSVKFTNNFTKVLIQWLAVLIILH